MLQAIKKDLKVLPGGIVQLYLKDVKPNTTVSVSAVIETKEQPTIKLQDMIGKGKGVFKSREEADRCIRNEREAWDE